MEIDSKPVRHKGMGIASFSMALVALVANFLFFLVAVQLDDFDHTYYYETFDMISALILVFLGVVGIGLGVAGVFDKTSKKVFPILGITLGTAPLWVWLYALSHT